MKFLTRLVAIACLLFLAACNKNSDDNSQSDPIKRFEVNSGNMAESIEAYKRAYAEWAGQAGRGARSGRSAVADASSLDFSTAPRITGVGASAVTGRSSADGAGLNPAQLFSGSTLATQTDAPAGSLRNSELAFGVGDAVVARSSFARRVGPEGIPTGSESFDCSVNGTQGSCVECEHGAPICYNFYDLPGGPVWCESLNIPGLPEYDCKPGESPGNLPPPGTAPDFFYCPCAEGPAGEGGEKPPATKPVDGSTSAGAAR